MEDEFFDSRSLTVNEGLICGLCVGAKNGKIKLCDANCGKSKCTFKFSRLSVPVWALTSYSIKYAPRIVSGADDTLIRILDPLTGKELAILGGHSDSVTALCCQVENNNSSSLIVSGSFDKCIRVWEFIDNGGTVVSVTKRHLLCGGHDDCVLTVAIACGNPVSGSRDRKIIVWDLHAASPMLVLQGQASHIFDLAVFTVHDSIRLASCAGDETLCIWDLEKGLKTGNSTTTQLLLHSLSGHLAAVTCLCTYHTSTSLRLVSASIDTTVRLWDAASGKQLTTLKGHNAPIHALVVFYHYQLPRIASGSEDMSIRIWDGTVTSEVSNTVLYVIDRIHASAITSMTFVYHYSTQQPLSSQFKQARQEKYSE